MARRKAEQVSRRPAVILGRVAWAALVLLTAMGAVGLQMDRAARKDIWVARSVPPAFQGYALETLAREAYAANNNRQGLAHSRELVRRRPVPAENLALLTYGLMVSGQNEAALSVLLLSAQRGWRDSFTQRLMAASAEQAGQPQVAAQRLLALWRMGNPDPQTKALSQAVLTNSKGLATFSQGIVQNDRGWGTNILVWGAESLPAQSMRAIIASMARQHVKMDCERLSGTVRSLLRGGMTETAVSLWSGLCANGKIKPLNDFDFGPSRGSVDPFGWQFPEQAYLDVELAESTAGTALQYEYSGQIRVAIAKRNSALEAGMYIARLDAEGIDQVATRPLGLQITCYSESRTSVTRRFELDRRGTSFEIPPAGCVGQEFTILAARGNGQINRLIITAEK